MKITAIEPQRKNPRRFSIHLDGVFGFGADEDTVVKFRLVPGKQLDTSEVEAILQETEVGKLMAKMYNLFSFRQRSEKEVRDYLRNLNFKKKTKDQEQISEVIIESLIQNLKNKGLLNDEVFARAWLESRRRSKKKGMNVIRMELFQKGISREIVDEVISSQQAAVSEADLAKEALEKKARVWKNLEKQEFKKKATEFLVRRGFDYSTAKEVVENFLSEEYTSS